MDALRCQAVCLPTRQSGRLHIWITVIKTVTTVTKASGAVSNLESWEASGDKVTYKFPVVVVISVDGIKV